MSGQGTVLVTGGAGYIGSHTVRALRALDLDVVVLDSLELGDADAVIDAPLVVGDITDRDLVDVDLSRSTASPQVVHFAAYKSVGESMVDAGPVLAQQRRRHRRADRSRASLPTCGTSCSRRRARCTARRPRSRSTESRTDPARERLRRDQGDGRTDAPLVRRRRTVCGR